MPLAAAAPAGTAASLVVRAGMLLRDGDVAAWRGLFAEAAVLDGWFERWAVRRALLESVLAQRDLPAAVLAEALLAAAQVAVDLLDEDPRDPVLLNLGGVFSYELGAYGAAEALFRAAARLEPQLEHVERNIRESRRRRKAGGGPVRGLAPQVLRALRTFGPRAERVAARAVPARGQTLSLCMIVKDEEAMLPKCLAAAREAVDEIIVVDTGSTDRTIEIAEEFGARVLHHEWTGDFAAARNVSFEAATSDWLMFLDADEVLMDGDAERLRELTGRTWREAFFLVETNHTGDLEDGMSVTHDALRVFRNRPEYRFEGRIHEQIAHRLPPRREKVENSTVRIEHFGYLGAVRDAKGKSRRNIELLQRQVDEGNDSPFLHFNLGSEYMAAGDAPRALEYFERAWTALADKPNRQSYGFFPSLSTRYVKALSLNGRQADALAVGDEILGLMPELTDVVFEQAAAHRGLGDEEAALAALRRCQEMGDAASRYSGAVGAGRFLARAAESDVLLALGDVDGAVAALRRCLEEHPGFIGAIDPLVRALLRQGSTPGDICATVHELAGPLTPAARFLLAVPLYEAGATEQAEVELRGLLEAQPTAYPARIALAEALLSQGRLDDAAAEAEKVPAQAPHAPVAARTVLFALLAMQTGDTGRLERAFARAREADVLGAEVRALEAWRDGAPAADSVPGDAAPLVAMMLEALARIQEFDAFERLVSVAEALAVGWRERRELLAGVYLRRGFLESAADEWISVVQRTGADLRALTGLAKVAEMRGFEDDAQLFRQEAEALGVAA
jgi:glycosyltransferase involved in cell wall biosynthesis